MWLHSTSSNLLPVHQKLSIPFSIAGSLCFEGNSCEETAAVRTLMRTTSNDDVSDTTNNQQTWGRIAVFLVSATLVYNLIEAGVSIWAGVDAGSVALIGFGLDSIIESAAAVALLYRVMLQLRLSNNSEDATGRLNRVERGVGFFVAVTFVVLAAYVTAQSIWILSTNESPEESIAGIAIAAISLAVMPLVAWGKIRAASKIGSPALRAEAKETLACCYLSFTLLIGLAFNALFGWWQADPIAALLMVPWLLKEGLEGIGCFGDDDEEEEDV